MRHAVLIGADNRVKAASTGFAETFGFGDSSDFDAIELIHPDLATALLRVLDNTRADSLTRNIPLVQIWFQGQWVKAKLSVAKQDRYLRLDIHIVETFQNITKTAAPISAQHPNIPDMNVAELRAETRKDFTESIQYQDTAILEIEPDGTVTYCAGNWDTLGFSTRPVVPTLDDIAKFLGDRSICAALSNQLAKAVKGHNTTPVDFLYEQERWQVHTAAIQSPRTVGKYNILIAFAPVANLVSSLPTS